MSYFTYVNFYETTLSAALSSTATTMNVSTASGLPSSLASGEIIPIVLTSASNNTVHEIVYVTAISGTTLTITRGEESTSALSWSIGDYVACGTTAGSVGVSNIQNATANNEPVALGQFSATLALPGYQKLPNGLIIQWLTLTGPVGSGTAFNWPIAFPNKVLSANATDTGSDAYRYGIGSASQTGGTMYALGGTTGASATCFCTAIGY